MTKNTDGIARVSLSAFAQRLAKKHTANAADPKSTSVSIPIQQLTNTIDEALNLSLQPDFTSERVANWLLDNDYQLERALRQIKQDISQSFYQELPGIFVDDNNIIPRVLDLAHAIVTDSQLQITRSVIVRIANAYQQHTDLQHGELWALPAMLRLACLTVLTRSLEQLEPQLSVTNIPSPPGPLPINDPTECIARSIASLHVLNNIDWKVFVDELSALENILSADPAGAYQQMNFDTRERYRQAIETLAKKSVCTEHEVAKAAIAMSEASLENPRYKHVGYWLIDEGLYKLESKIGVKPVYFQIARLVQEHTRSLYLVLMLSATLFGLWLPYWYLNSNGASHWQLGLSLVLLLIPASVLGITVVHWLVPMFTNPGTLPALEFKNSIPAQYRCAVTIPVILKDTTDARIALQKLELQYLANPDPALLFVLLSDLADASDEYGPEDNEIESVLKQGIESLNKKQTRNANPFILLHRRRQYNKSEGYWMGWERKRGKLDKLNQLILTSDISAFPVVAGKTDSLIDTKYVVTLDADTLLSPGSVAKLVGTIAHPLNRAAINAKTGRVESGYTVLQPRVELIQDAFEHSVFAKLYAGDSSIDIYSQAVSDVYQDLFDSGLYIGKGIYDVAAFQQCVDNRMPENRVLSHDLIEGVHGRVGLVSNIVVYEQFPDTYPEYAMRQHRWIRGDWQLLPWLRARVPLADDTMDANPLSLLDRWKLIDNLRRSLVPPALLLLLILGWIALPGSAWVWTALALAVLGSYILNDAWKGISQSMTLQLSTGVIYGLQQQTGRWFLSIVFLVNDAAVAIDAIVRTLWRNFVSHRRLLEWRSADHSRQMLSGQSAHRMHWKTMWPGTVFALVTGAALYWIEPHSLWAAAPVLLLWILAPEIAFRLGQQREFRREVLSSDDRIMLLEVARRTWHYFDTFTRPQDHWLPPDNFQEAPRGEIAHRTSPTNIGLYLVSAMAARDLNFIGTTELTIRISNTLNTLERLEMYQGHLLNWYNTSTLEALEPKYVSTVDNGNLAFSLLAVKQGCTEYEHKPIFDRSISDGLNTSFSLLVNAIEAGLPSTNAALDTAIQSIKTRINCLQATNSSWHPQLTALINTDWPMLQNMIGDLLETESLRPLKLHDIHTWYERFNHQVLVLHRDRERLFPWLPLITDELRTNTEWGELLRPELTFEPLDSLINISEQCLSTLNAYTGPDARCEQLGSLKKQLSKSLGELHQLQRELRQCAERADGMAYSMNFDMLYDSEAHLFRIGYNVSTDRFDNNTYDLLASEARLASFFAIAKKDVPIEHWAHLGRPVSRVGRHPVLLSWSGSMFEYLMPPLFLPGKRDTLLGESEKLAVISQRQYARERGVPWGISESAFGALDADDNYQYRAFGAPTLGLKRGLSHDLVIAPYASALALCVLPATAVDNLQTLRLLDAEGLYGFIDALDFTENRRTASGTHQPVKTYMAHHQGMTLAAVLNALMADVLVTRVLREKSLQTIELLLQERIPWDAPVEKGRQHELTELPRFDRVINPLPSWEPRAGSDVPQMQLLGNGAMSSWISAYGGGALFFGNYALTRWSSYPTGDAFGQRLYIKTDESPEVHSLARSSSSASTAVFAQHMVEHHQRLDNVVVRQHTTVAPSDNVEIRAIYLHNDSNQEQRLSLTSYAEVSLAAVIEDERHPAFSKLFVHSEFLAEHSSLLYTRRSRDKEKHPPFFLHRVAFDDPDIKLVGFESDRKAFLGRHGSKKSPQALAQELAGGVGWTQDAVMALQVQVTLQPGTQKHLAYLSIAANTRHEVIDIAQRYPSPELDWVMQDASMEASHEISQLEIDPERLPELQSLVSTLLHPVSILRVHPGELNARAGGQSVLWQFGISGDIPILLLKMASEETSGVLEYLIRAQHLWRRKRLEFDLVVLRRDSAGYEEPLRENILSVLRDFNVFGYLGRRGGIHLLSADYIDPAVCRSVESLATVVINDNNHTLSQQLELLWHPRSLPPLFDPMPGKPYSAITELERSTQLLYDNGIGGFDPNTGDYVIHIEPGKSTPSPWCNVMANETFGTVVSESGLGFTWLINSGEFRLTPWANDPVTDSAAEILYLRDEMNADKWSVTPKPLAHDHAVGVTHGPGFTRWVQHSHGLQQTLTVSVAVSDPVKLMHLQLHNPSDTARRITATYYVDWCLGAVVSQARPHVRSSYDTERHSIFAHNTWNKEFAECVAFVSATVPPHSISGDRSEFLGSSRDVEHPQGLERWDLGGHFSPTADACAAYQIHLDIAPGATEEAVFILGAAQSRFGAEDMLLRWQTSAQCLAELDAVQAAWSARNKNLQVKTPDPAFDLMINRWLPYQALSCRLFARAGYYQAGGAFGFRDQLQDVLSLIGPEPDRVRAQIIEAAKHQFEQGDALHWWHPPAGRGVRTRCSDDYIWLVYVVARYIKATGDAAILDIEVPFLQAPPLRDEEHDRYSLFDTGEVASIYTHCCRALQYMQRLGAHGLPLIGDGDWNDGMNRVGNRGQGESVWLAWFQIATIALFKEFALEKGDKELVLHWQRYVEGLKRSVEANAWDGEWYIRAFDDEGVAWGSTLNDECKIDSLSQSWAVICGEADEKRAATAMASAATHLLDAEYRLVRLLAPPFDHTVRDPGYIKAYPPGVRENGGQYTHAATWFGLAAAALGEGDKALQIFDIISPIRRTLTAAAAQHYAREPYVLPGDVSGSVSDPGRGGWSWYTGAASWSWQLGVHGILGIEYVPDGITINPCLPTAWKHAEVTITQGTKSILVRIENSNGISGGENEVYVDGVIIRDEVIHYPPSNTQKNVRVRIVPAFDPDQNTDGV